MILRQFFRKIFGVSPKTEHPNFLPEVKSSEEQAEMRKYLIVGLGNIGPDYVGTRHNIGFLVADRLAADAGAEWRSCRYGDMVAFNVKNCRLMVLKPSTFMNLSGVAVRYWMNKEKMHLENLLVIVDDLALPFGKLRLRGSGSDAGHNGLKNIASELGTQNYARLRFGIGNDYTRGAQINFVLGRFEEEEERQLPARIEIAADAVRDFCLSGLSHAMTNFNSK